MALADPAVVALAITQSCHVLRFRYCQRVSPPMTSAATATTIRTVPATGPLGSDRPKRPNTVQYSPFRQTKTHTHSLRVDPRQAVTAAAAPRIKLRAPTTSLTGSVCSTSSCTPPVAMSATPRTTENTSDLRVDCLAL